MATSAGTLLQTLSTRIRDPLLMSLSTVTPPDPPPIGGPYSLSGLAFALRLLSDAQTAVNLLENNILTRQSFPLRTGQSFYQISDEPVLSAALVRPIGITVDSGSNYDLVQMPFKALAQADLSWYGSAASMPRSWGMMGIDAFFVYPAPRRSIPATVIGPSVMPPLAVTSFLLVDDSLVRKVLDVAEALAYLKTRNLDFFETAMKRVYNNWDLMDQEDLPAAHRPNTGGGAG